jgi:N-acetylneuraminate synthase/N,N'-diacetyllegionaminate synthase
LEKGLTPFSTPSYYDDVELLEKLASCAYKTGADDCQNLPFLKYIASKNKPLIISTGMSYLWEAGRLLETLKETGNKDIILLHTLSNYPITDLKEINLKAMKTMADAYDVLTGFSDHSTSLSLPAAGVALGMSVYERHFTLDKKIPAPDCAFSADPEELKTLVNVIRETEAALGTGIKVPAGSEVDMRQETRKSLMAKVDLPAGSVISRENTIIKRPGTGIQPCEAEYAYGKKIKTELKQDAPIEWSNID